ncbi:MAG TPA: hypothetical protein VH137_04770 [Gemmatimonadales bacterium]|nr:hypothetical protein [Gemmatimonadales bacterium]
MRFEQLERSRESLHGGLERGLANGAHLPEQLERIADVLAGRLEGGASHRPAPAFQRAAPLRAAPAIHHAAAFLEKARHGAAAGHVAPVDAVSTVGKQAGGIHEDRESSPVR